MKSKRLWIFLGGIAVLGAVFLFLNFRLAVSNTQSEKHLNTASIGEQMPVAMQSREKITIALAGEGPLVNLLNKTLVAEMQSAGIGEFELVQDRKPVYPNPVLVVQAGKPGLLWTPFFATGQLAVQVGYASNGDTTFMGKSPVSMDNKDGPALNAYGEYTVRDRSWGLISRLGYHQILADYLAQQIAAMLKDLYKVS